MALINDPDSLSQGTATNSGAVTVGSISGSDATFTSAATLPLQAAGDFFVVRNSPDAQNNGIWIATGSPTTSSLPATKVTGSDPVAGGPDTLDFLGSTADKANICYDVATRQWALVEFNGLSADGVNKQTVYSKMMMDWKDDPFLIANAPFPMLTIDADAGKFIQGQDASGNFSGWRPYDDATHSIRTRKLCRNGGWTEYDSSGNILAIYPGIITLGNFEDETPVTGDTAYFQFGTDTTVDDTVDYDFTGPVNEAVLAFERLDDASINGGSGVSISADGRTLTRSDGGNWSSDGDDGFKVGGRILLRDAENSTSDGDPTAVFGAGAFKLSVVGQGVDGAVTMGTDAASTTTEGFDFIDGGGGDDSIDRNDGGSWLDEGYFVGGTVTSSSSEGAANDFGPVVIQTLTALSMGVPTGTVAAATDDNTAVFGPLDDATAPDTAMNAAIDNRNEITSRLRVRDADTNGKTFGQANLASAGKTQLGGLVFSFPLANVTDLKITETDANIDGNTPYTNMTLTVHSTPQSLGGSGADELVGGPYNFGFTIDTTTGAGTDIEVFEWIQRQLRKTTDIDNDGDIVIGRTLDGLARFLGDALEMGSVDGGLTFPVNPQGGGSGVMITGLNSASRNTTTVFDNLGTARGFPIGTTVTLDFNQTLIDDTVAEYTLYFDYTIRTNVSDLAVNTGTGPIGTIDSAGSNLPAALNNGVGAYIRVSGILYQVTTIGVAQYDVIRYDGQDIVASGAAALDLDEHPFDSPDVIIVEDNIPTDVQGLASADFVFTFDYSNNVQGGRTGGTDADVICRAVGQSGAQYTQSSVQTIESGIALTIPVSSNIERNFSNP